RAALTLSPRPRPPRSTLFPYTTLFRSKDLGNVLHFHRKGSSAFSPFGFIFEQMPILDKKGTATTSVSDDIIDACLFKGFDVFFSHGFCLFALAAIAVQYAAATVSFRYNNVASGILQKLSCRIIGWHKHRIHQTTGEKSYFFPFCTEWWQRSWAVFHIFSFRNGWQYFFHCAHRLRK